MSDRSSRNINWPLIIIVATVFVSATRWIPALMRSEGFEIPEIWMDWWVPASAGLAVGQPIVEAVSIAFALNAYRYMKNDSQKNLMMALIGGTLVSFVGVLTPNIVASGSSRSVYELLGDWMWFWGISVVLSTVMPVAAVAFGAARMSESPQKANTVKSKDVEAGSVGAELTPVALPEPQAKQIEAPKSPSSGYQDFSAKMASLNGDKPKTISQVEKVFGLSHATASRYLAKYKAKQK